MFNPYSVNEPAEDLFCGRQTQVERLRDNLMAPKATSYALVGGRRFGKTSLLYALERYFLDAFQDTDTKAYYRVVPVYVNLLSDEIKEWADFFALSTRFLNHQVQEIWPDALSDPDMLQISPKPADDVFIGLVRHLSKEMRSRWGPIRIALLIDETEEILDRSWRHTLFNKLRWLTYDNRHTNKLFKIVMAGSSGFYTDVSQKGSPLWGVLKAEFLEAFSEEASLQLIQEPCDGQLSEESAQLIVRLSGGHPFIVQYIMHELWEKGVSTSQPDGVRLVADGFRSVNWKHLEQWKQDIGETAHRVYLALSEQKGWVDKKEIQSCLGGPPTLTPALSALCYHGFAVHDGSWQRYRWVGELFCEWLLAGRKAGGQDATELSPEVQAQGVSLLFDIGRLAASELKQSWILTWQGKGHKRVIEVDFSKSREDVKQQIDTLLQSLGAEHRASTVEQALGLIERKRDLIFEWQGSKVENEKAFNREEIKRAALQLCQQELNQKITDTMAEIGTALKGLGVQVKQETTQ